MTEYALRLRPNKVGSVCGPLGFGPYVTVRPEVLVEEGAAIACRVLSTRKEYGHLELESGRQARLVKGDIILGVLGNRAALRGFTGRVPTGPVRAGDTLHLLNMGGVVGVSSGAHVTLGEPILLEVLGTPTRDGKPIRLSDHALPRVEKLPAKLPPVLVLIGTCMDSGKSTAGAVIVRQLRDKGLTVHAGKLTGVAAIRDLLAFYDNGANRVLSFLDVGLPSTCHRKDAAEVARTVLAELAKEGPDLILLEMGDGLLGEYGVDDVVADPEFGRHVSGAVLAANDLIGAYAAAAHLQKAGITVRCVTGPATDNAAGTNRLKELGLPAANTLLNPDRMVSLATEGLVSPPEEPG